MREKIGFCKLQADENLTREFNSKATRICQSISTNPFKGVDEDVIEVNPTPTTN